MQSIEQIKERDRIMNEFHEFLKTDVGFSEFLLEASELKETRWGRQILEWCTEIVESSRE